DEIRKVIETICRADQQDWPRGTKRTVRGAVKEFFDDAKFLHSLAAAEDGNDPLAEEWQWVRQPMLTLLELAREFTAGFADAKRKLGGVDFADLEQFALQLLRDPGTSEPTKTAEAWQRKLR